MMTNPQRERMEDLVIEKVDPMEDMTNPQRERMEDLEDLVIEKVDMTNPQRERMEDLEDLVIEKVEPMENEKVDAMEDEKVDEMVVPSDEMEDLRKIYQAAMKEDWDAMKKIFKNNAKLVLYPMTVDSDTPFHIAAYSGRKELLQYLCDQLKPSNSILKALSQKNNHGNNTFHEVATTNIVEAADFLVRKLREAHHDESDDLINDLLEDRNKLGETPLYMAATLGHTKMAKFLAKFVDDISRHFQRYDGVSILHLAVLGQHFDTAIWLLRKDKNLATDMRKENVTTSMGKENEGLTCLQLLAKMPSSFRSSSHMHKLKKFLYFCLPDYMEDVDDDHHHDEAQTSSSQMRDLERGQSSNSLPKSKKRSSGTTFRIYHAMWRGIAKEWSAINELWKIKVKHTSALELIELLVEVDVTWKQFHNSKTEDRMTNIGNAYSLGDNKAQSPSPDITIEEDETKEQSKRITIGEDETKEQSNQTSYSPLLIAASNGIVEIFDNMLKVYPQGIEHISKDEQNILHVAISHRQREIFKRIKKMKMIINRLASRIDNKGYTILHHVADMSNYHGRNQPGPAFQLQLELKWFERVQRIIPTHYVMHHDKKGMTPHELFETEHAELLEKAQKWIKETSQSCSAVSVLVATVVFAAAYTIPGGNDLSGRPNFINSPFFLFFTVMDVVSLACSLTSVVMFLSILSSPFEYENFHRSLPRKLRIGFTLLFFSVTTTMLSFAATIFLILHFERKTWTSTLIYTASFLPVTMFALMQFPLYASFTNTLQTLIKKIVKKTLSPKIVPRFLRTRKGKNH